MGGAPTPKWDPIGFDPQPFGFAGSLNLKEIPANKLELTNSSMFGWNNTMFKGRLRVRANTSGFL